MTDTVRALIDLLASALRDLAAHLNHDQISPTLNEHADAIASLGEPVPLDDEAGDDEAATDEAPPARKHAKV